MNSKTAVARIAVVFAIALIFATPRLLALEDHNPIGVTGAFEGVITTGGAYNVLKSQCHAADRRHCCAGRDRKIRPEDDTLLQQPGRVRRWLEP